MLTLHRSNRMENLAAALATVVASPLPSPLEAECIVVQSRGMERWLSMKLSETLGVWANPRFPFPGALLEEVFDAVLGETEPGAGLSRETLTFMVARLLPDHLNDDAFSSVRAYLDDDPRGLKRIELAQRIADAFDQYAVYRPELVRSWDQGQGEDWQARLWRAVFARTDRRHVAARARHFIERWKQLETLPPGLPTRLSVVGISSLPPIYLQVLVALAKRIDVHLFCLSPSREYAAELRSQREILRELRRAGAPSGQAEQLGLAEGHPLLASLGRSGRHLQQLLEELTDYVEDDSDLYVDPGTDTLLHTLQSDILALRHRHSANPEAPPRPVRSSDDSIMVHACHSPLREVEVLRDQLLDLFDRDPSLEPSDVLVLVPEIEACAPFIDAVFGAETGEQGYIPFRVADRTHRALSPVAELVVALLERISGRLTASGVLDLLEHEPIRERFSIAADSLPLIRRWVRESGVRWGLDATDRQAYQQPALDANTWVFGLRRLLLGYAAAAVGDELLFGMLPYDDVEGPEAEVLGQFCELCETLFEARAKLRQPRPWARWKEDLGALFGAMVAPGDEQAWELQYVRDAVAELAEDADAAGFVEPVDLAVVRALLDARLVAERSHMAFLSGGVTFCAMLPMRSIPFRVICLMGMNDGEFPRSARVTGFDLVAADPRPGDRVLRDEDRNLFLEALLSARDRLIITYIGRSVRDNTELPPSVVVSELLDALDEAWFVGDEGEAPATGSVAARRTVVHPLQPFSPRYFTARPGSSLWSFSAADAYGAQALVSRRVRHRRLFSEPLAAPDDAARQLTVEDLCSFFENPARGILRGRLRVYLDEEADLTPDREPVTLDGLTRHAVGTDLLARALRGEDVAGARAVVRASGVLPLGVPGDLAFSGVVPQVTEVAARATPWLAGERREPLEVRLLLGDFEIRGVLTELWPTAQVRAQYSTIKPRSMLAAWVRHLMLCAVDAPQAPTRTVLVGRGRRGAGAEQCVFQPLQAEAARARLTDLLELYWLGQRAPLCLFPTASYEYATKLAHATRGQDPEAYALAQARDVFAPPSASHARPERDDAYVALVFADVDPLDPHYQLFERDADVRVPSFGELAVRVFAPLCAALEEAP